jgi:hypothetical protein
MAVGARRELGDERNEQLTIGERGMKKRIEWDCMVLSIGSWLAHPFSVYACGRAFLIPINNLMY